MGGFENLTRGDVIFLMCVLVPFSILCLTKKQVGYELDGRWERVEAFCPNPGEWEKWDEKLKGVWAKRNMYYKPMPETKGCYRR